MSSSSPSLLLSSSSSSSWRGGTSKSRGEEPEANDEVGTEEEEKERGDESGATGRWRRQRQRRRVGGNGNVNESNNKDESNEYNNDGFDNDENHNLQQQQQQQQQPLLMPLCIDSGDSTTATIARTSSALDQYHGEGYVVPLDECILNVVDSCPNRTIRPARLAAEVGTLTVTEACAELCGLLAAVGGGADGATFFFEDVIPVLPIANDDDNDDGTSHNKNQWVRSQHNDKVMVFVFPPDFRRRAVRRRRQQSAWQIVMTVLHVAWRVLKIATALGLILSLLILAILAIASLVALLIALSSQDNRSGGGGSSRHHRAVIARQIRAIAFAVRETLWFYAVFGRDAYHVDGSESDQDTTTTTQQQQQHRRRRRDPLLREIAMDLSLVLSLCCGNPFSMWYWWRATRLSRRRQRMTQGWTAQLPMSSSATATTATSDDDVDNNDNSIARTIRQDNNNSNSDDEPVRGLLSLLVEFLFGPSPANPGPSDAVRWKLRATALMDLSTPQQNGSRGIALNDLVPWMDRPPPRRNHNVVVVDDDDDPRLVEQGLVIVAHFNGKPWCSSSTTTTTNNRSNQAQSRFVFPELLAERDTALLSWNGSSSNDVYNYAVPSENGENDLWYNLLYVANADDGVGRQWRRQLLQPSSSPSSNTALRQYNSDNDSDDDDQVVLHLHERFYKLTLLSHEQFFHCLLLGVLNAVGVAMIGPALSPNSILELPPNHAVVLFLRHGLLPVLRFYAVLFFALPAARLGWIVFINCQRRDRNRHRRAWAQALNMDRGKDQQQQQQNNSSSVNTTATAAGE